MNTGHYHKHEINTAFPFLAETHPQRPCCKTPYSKWEEFVGTDIPAFFPIVTPRGKSIAITYTMHSSRKLNNNNDEQQQG
jgi:hypothetical protein